MRSDLDNLPDAARLQLQLTRRFAAGLIAGPAFETAFLEGRMRIHDRIPSRLADVLVQIFYGVDDYVADDSLREPEKGDLDEGQLREVVRAQLRRLDEV